MRLFLSLLAFAAIFTIIFFCFYDDITLFITIPLIALDMLLLFFVYQSFTYRLALREKHEIVLDMKINLEEVMNKKLDNKKRNTKFINTLLKYSLYASPVLIMICIAIGIFIANSVLLAIVLPAFIITYLLILFFVKDIYESLDVLEEKEVKESFIVNKKSVIYMGKVYLINDCGFYLRDNKYKFLFIPLAKINMKDELKTKLEEAFDEIRSK